MTMATVNCAQLAEFKHCTRWQWNAAEFSGVSAIAVSGRRTATYSFERPVRGLRSRDVLDTAYGHGKDQQ